MILLSRLNGQQIKVNADLIECAEATPNTVVTLVDGTAYVIAESLQEVIARMRLFRASLLVTRKQLLSSAGRPGATRALPRPS